VRTHFQQPNYRDNLFIDKIDKIGFKKTGSEIEALLLEAKLIKKYRPKYNVVWKDDKNYFYVGITKEEFPKVFITHQPGGFEVVGPFVDGKALKETLKVLRQAFPFRSCNFLPKSPCLWYQLNRCPAPCLTKSKTAEQIPTLRKNMAKEIKRNIKSLVEVLKGNKTQVSDNLKREMKSLSKQQEYETAIKIRNQIISLEKILSHSRVLGSDGIYQKRASLDNSGHILQKMLNVKNPVNRIEAYDISNIQGKEATGSMVTFTNGFPEKSLYRKFKIRREQEPNDIAMLKEVLERRLRHGEWPLPDLMLIDGGKAQLNIAKRTVKGKIPVLAIAKKKNELYLEKRENPILLKSLPREVFNLILGLRDEAHRFAITYHKKLREKSLLRQ
jgi:excinuclease ABC subunit C